MYFKNDFHVMQYVMQLICMQNTSWIKKAHVIWE